jgi:hypothetical protein
VSAHYFYYSLSLFIRGSLGWRGALWRTEIGKWSGVKIREIIDYDILYSTLLELINDTL